MKWKAILIAGGVTSLLLTLVGAYNFYTDGREAAEAWGDPSPNWVYFVSQTVANAAIAAVAWSCTRLPGISKWALASISLGGAVLFAWVTLEHPDYWNSRGAELNLSEVVRVVFAVWLYVAAALTAVAWLIVLSFRFRQEGPTSLQ